MKTYRRPPSPKVDRPSIVMPSRPIDIGGGCMASGRKPGIIVHIDSTSKNRREFERFCDRNAIDYHPVEFLRDDLPCSYECIGSLPALERLSEHPVVRDWHLILSVRITTVSAGSGEIGLNAERAERRRKMHRPDREALEETERRAKLPRDDRERIELAELVERERVLA